MFEVEELYPGYGITLGNALRRVLLSSLEGAAATSFRIKGISHEFSTLPGVIEDVIEISLNLKKLRLKLFSSEQQKLKLSVKGEKVVKAGDFEENSEVQIINPDLHLAALTEKNAELELEVTVDRGIGYLPSETRKKEKLPIGVIALDAIFSPIRRVNFEVENMRVGDRTDFNRLRIHIETDGTISPLEALKESTQILIDHFQSLILVGGEEPAEAAGVSESEDITEIPVEELNLSRRTTNALSKSGVKTVGGLMRQRLSEMAKIKGLGDKGVEEIKKALSRHGLEIKE